MLRRKLSMQQTNLIEMPRRTHDYANDFNDWWKSLGPLKVGGKRRAQEIWNSLSVDQREPLVSNTPSWVRYYRGRDYVPHATTWLSRGDWEDPAPGYEDWISQACYACSRAELRVVADGVAECRACGCQQHIKGE